MNFKVAVPADLGSVVSQVYASLGTGSEVLGCHIMFVHSVYAIIEKWNLDRAERAETRDSWGDRVTSWKIKGTDIPITATNVRAIPDKYLNLEGLRNFLFEHLYNEFKQVLDSKPPTPLVLMSDTYKYHSSNPQDEGGNQILRTADFADYLVRKKGWGISTSPIIRHTRYSSTSPHLNQVFTLYNPEYMGFVAEDTAFTSIPRSMMAPQKALMWTAVDGYVRKNSLLCSNLDGLPFKGMWPHFKDSATVEMPEERQEVQSNVKKRKKTGTI